MSGDFTPEDYLFQLAHDPKPEVRRNAAWALGRLRDPRGAAALLAAAQDADASVRLRVAEALGSYKDLPADGLRALLDDAAAEVRAQAARSLANVQALDAVPALAAALADPDAGVRAQVAEALGTLGAAAAAAALVQALDDADEGVRYSAAQSLAEIGTPAVTALLAGLAAPDAPPARLVTLLTTLAKTATPDAASAIAPLEQHADDDVRQMAAWVRRVLMQRR